MTSFVVSFPAKWEQLLEQLANDHEIDLNSVVSELCEWAFSNLESKKQFEAWLDEAYPQRGEAEDKSSAAEEEVVEEEEEREEESEEESHEHRD